MGLDCVSQSAPPVSMAHSVEGRYPFLDYRVVEFCNRLPADLKLRGLREKWLLRQFGRKLLPDEIWQRAKIFCERGNQAFPLSELQAAVLLPQLQKLASRNAQRQRAVTRLLALLEGTPGLRPLSAIPLDSVPCYYKLAWLHITNERWSRERLIAAVQAEGVALDAGFRGFLRRGNRCRRADPLDHCVEAANSTVLLHHPVLLEADEQIDRVALAIRKVALAANS